jgi:hypothetical protein
MSIVEKIFKKIEKQPIVQNYISGYFFYTAYQKKIAKSEIIKCFKDNEQSNTINKSKLERICKAYQLAIKDRDGVADLFLVSNEWMLIYNQFMEEVILALNKGDVDVLSKIYANFMREKCSAGLHGLAIDMGVNYFNKKYPTKLNSRIYLNDANYRYELWKNSMGVNETAEALYMPEFGNSYGYFKDNKYIRTGAEYLHYYATAIKNLLSDKMQPQKTIIEIGGGYGGLGYFLNKNINNLTYVDFDLPENMALTAYYLMCCFPEKKIMLYGEDSLQNIKKYDIVILPNFCLDKIEDNFADLIFNSYSLAEMSPSTILHYVSKMKSLSKQYIFHVNHTNKSTSLNADSFGFDNDGRFSLLYKAKAMWNMYRNYRCDEYEYLYKKKV